MDWYVTGCLVLQAVILVAMVCVQRRNMRIGPSVSQSKENGPRGNGAQPPTESIRLMDTRNVDDNCNRS